MSNNRIVTDLYTFTDDHELCVSFTLDGRKLVVMWAEDRTIGALQFLDSPTAQAHLEPLFAAIDGFTDEQLADESFYIETDFGAVMGQNE